MPRDPKFWPTDLKAGSSNLNFVTGSGPRMESRPQTQDAKYVRYCTIIAVAIAQFGCKHERDRRTHCCQARDRRKHCCQARKRSSEILLSSSWSSEALLSSTKVIVGNIAVKLKMCDGPLSIWTLFRYPYCMATYEHFILNVGMRSIEYVRCRQCSDSLSLGTLSHISKQERGYRSYSR